MIGVKLMRSLCLGKPFNEESQELLTFLQGLMEEGLAPDRFFSKTKVGTSFSSDLFEQGVNLLMTLPHFQFDHQVDSYQTLLFQDLHADANLFTFTVTEYSDYFEMEISESPRSMPFIRELCCSIKDRFIF